MRIRRIQLASGEICHASERPDGSLERLQGSVTTGFSPTGHSIAGGKLLAPVEPTAIMCIGLNYRRHAEEGGQAIPQHPVLFMKTPSTLQNPEDPIVLPRKLRSDMVDYECELAVVIGRTCLNVSREDALKYVLGYTCAQRRLCTRLAAKRWRRSVVSRQNFRNILSARSRACHRRRNFGPWETGNPHHPE